MKLDIDINCLFGCFNHSHARSLQASPHPELQALSSVQPEASVHADLSPSTGVLLPNTPADPSTIHQQSSPAGAATPVSAATNQPLPTETPPVRERLGEDLFRLVQVSMCK